MPCGDNALQGVGSAVRWRGFSSAASAFQWFSSTRAVVQCFFRNREAADRTEISSESSGHLAPYDEEC
jgi:hypothetical protein